MALHLTTPIQIRFADVDQFGHVNNVAQQSYFDLGKTELFGELWQQSGELEMIPAVTVSVQTDFFKQLFWGDRLEVNSEVESLGNKSITLIQQIVRQGEVCSRSRTVLVCFDKQAQQSVSVPDAWRKIVER